MNILTIIATFILFLLIIGYVALLISQLIINDFGISETVVYSITIIIVLLLSAFSTKGIIKLHNATEEYLQNGCKCGGRYELYDIEYSQNRGDIYYYKCDKCGDIFETSFRIKLPEEN